mmetsp:Transcript_1911/g.2464  ORF Transcript_1911/g.2464 Transcript_1911/m.2464 type:complete len:251 (+) Transcript_1911:210-962(+)
MLGFAVSKTQLQRTAGAFLVFHSIQWLASLTVPKHLEFAEAKKWTDGWVGLAHHIVVCTSAFFIIMFDPEPSANEDRMYGFSDRINMVFSISTAYFMWDINTSMVQGLNDKKVYIHAVVCTLCYIFGQYPFLHYYGIRFLLFEVSSVFMQLRQLILLSDMRNTPLFSMVQATFGITFLVTRILYGIPLSLAFWNESIDLLLHGKPHSYYVVVFYFLANVILNALNVIWMYMIFRKFLKPRKPAINQPSQN